LHVERDRGVRVERADERRELRQIGDHHRIAAAPAGPDGG
jgi:hypothetical protein